MYNPNMRAPMTANGITQLTPIPTGRLVMLYARHVRVDRWARHIHAAPFWRCYLLLSGNASITYNSVTAALSPGIPTLIPPGTAFTTAHRAPFSKLFAHVSITWPGMTVPPGIHQARSRGLRSRCASIARALSEMDNASPMHLWLNFTAVISDAVALLPDTVLRHAPYSPRIMTVIEQMQMTVARPLANRTLADLIGMHENSFIRLFRQETGAAPAAYYRNIRLNAAAELLAERSAAIEDIAQRTGFCDRDHFTRAFTSHFSLPPARYRSMVRGG